MTDYPSISMTLPQEVLNRFIDQAKIFIETGTYDGRTVAMALNCGYTDIRSIELDLKYFEIAESRFKDNTNVKLYWGDSLRMLPAMTYDIYAPAVFWLDAHIQENVQGDIAAPILEELDIIATLNRRDNIILIDDKRLMGTPNSWWENITYDKVIERIMRINPKYIIELIDSNAAKKDIIAAFIP